MRIDNFNFEKTRYGQKAAATITWEDCDREPLDLFIEIETRFVDAIINNPHTFLVAAIMPALRFGERRVAIDAEIDPELRDNLNIALRLVHGWYDRYGPSHPLPQIEAKTMAAGKLPTSPHRAGFFISGGIDSLATLRANRLNYPLEHPGSFKDAIIIRGLQPEVDDILDDLLASLAPLAAEANVTLIPVTTNLRYIYDSWPFWADEFEAAVFSAVAHAFTPRLASMTIATSFDVSYLHPHGSHPLLDPHFSSSDMQIRHDDVTLTRLDKTAMLADWGTTLQRLRVCNSPNPESGVLNCGKCEKCLRTMLALTAMGKLKDAQVFPIHHVTADMVRQHVRLNKTTFPFYPELVAPLRQGGRPDLAQAVERKINYYTAPRLKRSLTRTVKRPLRLFRDKVLHRNVGH